MSKTQTYRSDAFKAQALAALEANGGNVRKTAEALKIPESTLRVWQRVSNSQLSASDCAQQKRELAHAFREVAWCCLDTLPDKLASASASQIAVVMGIAVEKALLLDGNPTAITQHKGAKDARSLFRELEAMMGKPSGPEEGDPVRRPVQGGEP